MLRRSTKSWRKELGSDSFTTIMCLLLCYVEIRAQDDLKVLLTKSADKNHNEEIAMAVQSLNLIC